MKKVTLKSLNEVKTAQLHHSKKMLTEFKEFAMKGNIFDLAVGVIIGTAFSKIVTSMVNDIIMPLMGLILGNLNFKELKVALHMPIGKSTGIILTYGVFIQNIIDFLIVAFCIFMFMKIMTKPAKLKFMKKKDTEEFPEQVAEVKEVVPELTNEEKLLTEIRDLLKGKEEISK